MVIETDISFNNCGLTSRYKTRFNTDFNFDFNGTFTYYTVDHSKLKGCFIMTLLGATGKSYKYTSV